MRPIRLAEAALVDIESQVPADRLEDFRSLDLRPTVEALSSDTSTWTNFAIPHGPGWRLSLEGISIAGFHLFLTEDLVDPLPDALVVYAIDIWLGDFPT